MRGIGQFVFDIYSCCNFSKAGKFRLDGCNLVSHGITCRHLSKRNPRRAASPPLLKWACQESVVSAVRLRSLQRSARQPGCLILSWSYSPCHPGRSAGISYIPAYSYYPPSPVTIFQDSPCNFTYKGWYICLTKFSIFTILYVSMSFQSNSHRMVRVLCYGRDRAERRMELSAGWMPGFLFINVFSMTYFYNKNKQFIIVNCINYPIIADSDSPSVTSFEFCWWGGIRIICQIFNFYYYFL
jgi:hypothetical protein